MPGHSKGIPFIVMAPSGAGKTSLVNALLKDKGMADVCLSISHTTRPRRPKEVDGADYHFVDEASFLEMLHTGAFLESAEVYGHRYGTSEAWVREKLRSGTDVILEIDWQGAAQIRNLMPDVCTIFILPPSAETLQQRLIERAQDDPATIASRMRQYADEISHVAEADYVVVNADFQTALDDMKAIFRAQRLTLAYQQEAQAVLLGKLTAVP
ncbi:MAG: hypothetical protein RLZZ385_2722 [Pseudomonadota bacterium]|jgi:guanylate kinase